MKNYFQIIIAVPEEDGLREPPFIYFIRESKVGPNMLEEMEYQLGDYPSWCMPSGDPNDDPSLCDIETFGTRACPAGGRLTPRTITRCFYYCC